MLTGPSADASVAALHAAFLPILARVERHGRVYFRHEPCPDRRAELVAEMVALSWRWYLRLLERGKHPRRFPSALATFAARAVRSGRQLCGQGCGNDVLSPLAQARHGFAVGPLPPGSSLLGTAFDEALHDNASTPPDEQAAFRVDFPAWLRTRTDRDRRLIADLIRGERTLDAAGKYGLTAGRVSQLRREFHDDWRRFCGEGAPFQPHAVA
jgi:hypothetical protein